MLASVSHYAQWNHLVNLLPCQIGHIAGEELRLPVRNVDAGN